MDMVEIEGKRQKAKGKRQRFPDIAEGMKLLDNKRRISSTSMPTKLTIMITILLNNCFS